MSYIYVKSEPCLWTVGYHTPKGAWEPESDHDSEEAAAKRVNFLNGGQPEQATVLLSALERLAMISVLAGDLVKEIPRPSDREAGRTYDQLVELLSKEKR